GDGAPDVVLGTLYGLRQGFAARQPGGNSRCQAAAGSVGVAGVDAFGVEPVPVDLTIFPPQQQVAGPRAGEVAALEQYSRRSECQQRLGLVSHLRFRARLLGTEQG